MTRNRSDADILRELASVNTNAADAYVLDLHVRHLRAAGFRPDTLRARRGSVLRLHNWLDEDNPRAVLDATCDQLAEWQTEHDYLATASMRHYIQQIQGFYAWCVRPARILDESPAEDLIKPIERRRLPRPIPEEDFAFALDACVDRRVRAWLILGGYAGLRSIDVASLNRDDLLTDRAVPFLRVRGKGDQEALVAVGREVIDAITPFLRGQGPLFVDDNGRRVSPRIVREEINTFLRAVGLPYTFHQARHRYGTKVYEITRDIRVTQRQLRHASVQSTEGYAAIPTDQDARLVESLDAELAGRRR